MKMSCIMAALGVAGCMLVPVAGLAADSSLVLIMGGEAYDGPPKFEVDFDGKMIGEGAVAAAIDTAKAGRFADAGDKTAYVQTFTFGVPETLFRPEGEVRIRFLNEANGGAGSNRDRNLYLASVALNGRAVTASGLTSETGGGEVANKMLGEFLVIPDGSVNAVSAAPSGGWPGAARVDPVTTSTVEVKATPAEEPEPVRPAALAPTQDAIACDLDEKYNVLGFNENSNALTAKLIARLDQVAADIGERQCNVQVTGYASTQGAVATNALFAVERAQNALRYLQEHGVKFNRASAAGVGATDEFGPEFAANRRVVITVTP